MSALILKLEEISMARIGKEKKEQIRKSILEKSKELFFGKGYDQTSTKEIAREVGIAEGTIFNYFKTKADIFLEVFSMEHTIKKIETNQYMDKGTSVLDIFMNFIKCNLKDIMIFPKGILKELGIASLNLAKSKPALIKKLAEFDFQVLGHLQELTEDLQGKGFIVPCDGKVLSDVIYSAMMLEFILYVYEKDRKKETMFDNIREKVGFILKGYV